MSDPPPFFQPPIFPQPSPGQPGSEAAAERAELLRLLDRHTAALDGVDATIARIEAGEYGRCAACGERLDDIVLDADPTARDCGDSSCPRRTATPAPTTSGVPTSGATTSGTGPAEAATSATTSPGALGAATTSAEGHPGTA